jgi:uncharacterized protein YqgC (DUF456 family)
MTGTIGTVSVETLLAAVLVVVGLVGVVVPVLPGLVLVVGGVELWPCPATTPSDGRFWVSRVALVVAGSVLKYLIPGRWMPTPGYWVARWSSAAYSASST